MEEVVGLASCRGGKKNVVLLRLNIPQPYLYAIHGSGWVARRLCLGLRRSGERKAQGLGRKAHTPRISTHIYKK